LEINNQYQIKRNNPKLFGQISAFICIHLRLIFVSLGDKIREIQFKLFPIINENRLVKSPQKAQSFAISVTTYEEATPSRFRTRMTRIFTDTIATAFYYTLFTCVHLRLVFVSLSDRTRKIQFKLLLLFYENGFVPVQASPQQMQENQHFQV